MSPRTSILRLTAIASGAAVIGLGINAFNIANQLAEGGVTGAGIILKLWLNIDPELTVIALNIPLLIWGFFALGWRSTWLSVYGVAVLSFWLWLFGDLRLPLEDPLLAAVYAGVAMGVGLGVIFRYGGTTGGVDILVRVLNKRFGWPMGRTMFVSDMLVLSASALYLDLRQVMYTLIAVFIGGRLIDLVETGAYRAKALLVASDRSEAIAAAVMDELDRGVTLLKTVGAYTGQERNALFIVCARGEVMRIKSIIHHADAHAFVAIHDINEVIGEGFARRS